MLSKTDSSLASVQNNVQLKCKELKDCKEFFVSIISFLGSATACLYIPQCLSSVLRPSRIRKKVKNVNATSSGARLLYMCTHCLLPHCDNFYYKTTFFKTSECQKYAKIYLSAFSLRMLHTRLFQNQPCQAKVKT